MLPNGNLAKVGRSEEFGNPPETAEIDCLDHSPQVEILGRHLTQIPRRKERLADAAEHMAVHLGSSSGGQHPRECRRILS